MDLLKVLLAASVGYLVGSISFARLVTKIFAPQKDITQTEFTSADGEDKLVTGFVSATTVSMHIGPRFGFITVVLDMLKIIVPTLIFRRTYSESPYFLITATTGMIGHIWPLYYGFKGGRGLSAVYGAMFAIDWIGVFITSIGGLLLGLFVFRDMLVAYMGGLWLTVPWFWFRTHDLRYVAYAVAANVIFVIAMIPEIRQFLKFKREGKVPDISETMQLTGMGRGIYKMAKRFGVLQDEASSDVGDRRQNVA